MTLSVTLHVEQLSKLLARIAESPSNDKSRVPERRERVRFNSAA